MYNMEIQMYSMPGNKCLIHGVTWKPELWYYKTTHRVEVCIGDNNAVAADFRVVTYAFRLFKEAVESNMGSGLCIIR